MTTEPHFNDAFEAIPLPTARAASRMIAAVVGDLDVARQSLRHLQRGTLSRPAYSRSTHSMRAVQCWLSCLTALNSSTSRVQISSRGCRAGGQRDLHLVTFGA